jgi:hypothetical protein
MKNKSTLTHFVLPTKYEEDKMKDEMGGACSTYCAVSARNGNSEVPVYFLIAKQGYTVRKIEDK